MVFLGHRRSLCCLAAHPQAPFLSGGGNRPQKKSWQEAVLQALGCSLSPQPHPSLYSGAGLGPRLGRIRGPTRASS